MRFLQRDGDAFEATRAFAEAAAAKGRAAYVQAADADWAATGDLAAIAVDEVSRLDDSGEIALFDLCNRLRGAEGLK